MKKCFLIALACWLFLFPTCASANPFIAPSKPAASWSFNDCVQLVGEDAFNQMLTEVKQNILSNLGDEVTTGFMYSPYLYAIIDSLIAEGVDPNETVFRLGDTSSDLNVYFSALRAGGYITDIPSSYNEEVSNAVRKIQFAAGLPATGELTNAIASGLLSSFAIPSNEETLKHLSAAANMISDKCSQEMATAEYANKLAVSLAGKNIDGDIATFTDAVTAGAVTYMLAHTYLPSYVIPYQMYLPVTNSFMDFFASEDDAESINIVANASACLYVMFYCAEYDLNHDFAEYAAEYYDLLKGVK